MQPRVAHPSPSHQHLLHSLMADNAQLVSSKRPNHSEFKAGSGGDYGLSEKESSSTYLGKTSHELAADIAVGIISTVGYGAGGVAIVLFSSTIVVSDETKKANRAAVLLCAIGGIVVGIFAVLATRHTRGDQRNGPLRKDLIPWSALALPVGVAIAPQYTPFGVIGAVLRGALGAAVVNTLENGGGLLDDWRHSGTSGVVCEKSAVADRV
ncbi:hypothetical protein C8Q76DRAFT_140822 [Earliella scabrosa]|nr:hypothetical protein C8Q76DRAFT_140822 [Earliella scabrosa]